MSQELRLSTPDNWRLRGLVGLFYEDYKVYDDTQWMYKSVPDCSPTGPTSNCFLPIQPWPGNPTNNPGLQPQDGFFDDFQRTFIQKAAYTSVSFDIVPQKLTITGGVRYFQMYNSELGGDVGSFYCKIFGTATFFGACGDERVSGRREITLRHQLRPAEPAHAEGIRHARPRGPRVPRHP